jgi:hypothetical protein
MLPIGSARPDELEEELDELELLLEELIELELDELLELELDELLELELDELLEELPLPPHALITAAQSVIKPSCAPRLATRLSFNKFIKFSKRKLNPFIVMCNGFALNTNRPE